MVTEVLKLAAGCEGHGWHMGCRQGFCQFCGFESLAILQWYFWLAFRF